VSDRARRPAFAERCARIAESNWFTAAVFTVIVLNAAVLGAQTYEDFERRHRDRRSSSGRAGTSSTSSSSWPASPPAARTRPSCA